MVWLTDTAITTAMQIAWLKTAFKYLPSNEYFYKKKAEEKKKEILVFEKLQAVNKLWAVLFEWL